MTVKELITRRAEDKEKLFDKFSELKVEFVDARMFEIWLF